MRLSILRRKKKKEQTNEKNKKDLPKGRAFRLAVSGPGRFKLKKEEPKHPKYLMDEEEELAALEAKFKSKKSRKTKKKEEAAALPHRKTRR